MKETGARLLQGCGERADRDWYRAILDQDFDCFRRFQARVFEQAKDARIDRIVCDPVEFYNPMHDLANALAHSVAHNLSEVSGHSVPVHTYQCVSENCGGREIVERIQLSKGSVKNKLGAAHAYIPLNAEVSEREELLARREERLFADPQFEWPARLSELPYYEKVGRERLSDGTYQFLITYQDHVRPVAHALLKNS